MTTSQTEDPWAELDALLNSAGVGATAAAVSDADGPVTTTQPDDAQPLTLSAPLLPAPPALQTAPGDLDAEQRRALTAKALLACHGAVDVIAETFAAQGADFDDAVKALPYLHRVLEHVEKLEAARKTAAVMPTAVLTIVLDGTPQVAPPRRRRPATEFIDIATD